MKNLTQKILFVFLINMLGIISFSQIDNSLDRNNPYDCEKITQNIITDVAMELENKNKSTLDSLVDVWISRCGISEITQRLLIIEVILQKDNSSPLISEYFENNFNYKMIGRIKDAKKINFGYLYTAYKSYYEYVPLRHKIDSVLKYISIELLKSNNLSSDEKLICTLFSGDLDAYKTELKKNKRNGGTINKMLNKKRRYYKNGWISNNLYVGTYMPFGNNKMNNTYGTFGLAFSSPLRYKLIIELGMKFRFTKSDETFKYFALEDTNNVKSESGIFIGGFVGYKIYETEKLIVIPKIGIGLENITTDLYTYKDDQKDYFEVKTVHTSFGVSMMTPVFNTSYLGLELSYHYNPYQLDKKLISKLNNSAFSAEIFLKF